MLAAAAAAAAIQHPTVQSLHSKYLEIILPYVVAVALMFLKNKFDVQGQYYQWKEINSKKGKSLLRTIILWSFMWSLA